MWKPRFRKRSSKPAAAAGGAPPDDAPTVLVTGANRGIGLALAAALAERGLRVVGTARRPDDAGELAAVAHRVEALDVTDDASVAALAAALDGEALDLLVHNAGTQIPGELDDLRPADLLTQMDVNAVGPLRVTRALRPHLARAAAPKLAFLSSIMGSMAENDGGWYGYRASKAALNAIVRCLHRDLAPWPCVCLHPGYVRTRMTGHRGHLEPEESAADLADLLLRLDGSMSGRFLDRFGEEIPW
jgi:NAD(P)-dependent dehydrogenase (short-subunit alcohol dehydrogenase family)